MSIKKVPKDDKFKKNTQSVLKRERFEAFSILNKEDGSVVL